MEAAQLVLDAVDLSLFDTRCADKDLDLHLCRHVRHTVLRKIAEIGTHVSRCHLDILHQILFHLLNELLVAELVVQLRAHVVDALLTIFLQLLLGASHLYPPVDLLVDALCYLSLGDLDRVDLCLVQEKLLHRNLLGDREVGVTAKVDTLGKALHTHLLHIRPG